MIKTEIIFADNGGNTALPLDVIDDTITDSGVSSVGEGESVGSIESPKDDGTDTKDDNTEHFESKKVNQIKNLLLTCKN